MRFQQSLPSTLLLLLSICLPAFSGDSFAEGQKLYAQGKFAQAAGLFNSYLIGHPGDATAQYYLGCSYVGLRRNDDAIEHYQQAIKLAPISTVAAYCRDEVTKLKALGPGTNDVIQTITSDRNPVSAAVAAAAKPVVKSDALAAVHSVNRQTDERENELQVEYAAKIKQVQLDAQVQINRLNQEKQEAVSELGPAMRGKNGIYWRPDTEPVNEIYRGRINDVNKETDRKIADLNLECKTRIDRLEQFAVEASRAYSGHDVVGTSRTNPASSNLHVHNYEIEADVSGNPTPLIASPAKLPAAKTSAH
ncbi:MAG: tetratricopeptide repeat protein [Candidatus Obscuribacterales bacterium]|nr:tetratricopeptide repeat protein [Candidatus Obscuribacterales bacterium]